MKQAILRAFILSCMLLIASCGGTESARPKVSRADVPQSSGITYSQFREQAVNHEQGGDSYAIQKRFVMLDRNNNGVLSPDEFNGY